MMTYPCHYASIVNSPIGKLGIKLIDGKLAILDFLLDDIALKPGQDRSVAEVTEALHCYFDNPHYQFKKSLHLHGTSFQQKVWQALQKIPAGKTLTYGELAKQLGSGAQAIGQACRTNPVPIFIPCHRITAAHHLGGYAGARTGERINTKAWLLQHEGHHFTSNDCNK